MTVRSITQSYETSSEAGRERHVLVPWARLTDATPTLGDPAAVLSRIAGTQVCGTVVNAGTTTTDEYVLINVAEGAVYRHNVRNVLTYTAGPVAEATWGAINVGDPVFYDAEQDTLNGIKLSTAPLTSAGAANPRFGTIILLQDQTASDFPTAATALSDVYAVMQTGLNES